MGMNYEKVPEHEKTNKNELHIRADPRHWSDLKTTFLAAYKIKYF